MKIAEIYYPFSKLLYYIRINGMKCIKINFINEGFYLPSLKYYMTCKNHAVNSYSKRVSIFPLNF